MTFKADELNPNWKVNAGIQAIHIWVRKRMPPKDKCWNCKTAKAYDLANKGIYDRNLDNWKWLCRRCHMVEDGRLERWLKNPAFPKHPPKICPMCSKEFFKTEKRSLCCSLSCGSKYRWSKYSKEEKSNMVRKTFLSPEAIANRTKRKKS